MNLDTIDENVFPGLDELDIYDFQLLFYGYIFIHIPLTFLKPTCTTYCERCNEKPYVYESMVVIRYEATGS